MKASSGQAALEKGPGAGLVYSVITDTRAGDTAVHSRCLYCSYTDGWAFRKIPGHRKTREGTLQRFSTLTLKLPKCRQSTVAA